MIATSFYDRNIGDAAVRRDSWPAFQPTAEPNWLALKPEFVAVAALGYVEK
jgi:hypothetical protein